MKDRYNDSIEEQTTLTMFVCLKQAHSPIYGTNTKWYVRTRKKHLRNPSDALQKHVEH